ncbi:trehalase family glycosidase [candidate division KSB1 bacterium]
MRIVNFLSREDKHYLGGGNRLLWTPNFPIWLDKPGFWDKAHYHNLDIEPVFTVTILDENGFELPLRLNQRKWFSSHIRNIYEKVDNIDFVEEKTLFENDVLSSNFSMTNTGEEQKTLHCILWTLQKSRYDENDFISGIDFRDNGYCFTKNINFRNKAEYRIECFLGMNTEIDSCGVFLSDNTSLSPEWKYTPFYEIFTKSGLDNKVQVFDEEDKGLIYIGVHKRVTLKAGEHRNLAAMFAASNKREETEKAAATVRSTKHPVVYNMNKWEGFFSELPDFACSDKFIEKYYWYRWYGIRMNTLREKDNENCKYPAVTEGPAYFRGFISYSAQCHMLETRWMQDPELAEGSILNFIDTQNEDGSFTGHIYPKYIQPESFYHSNWGKVIDVYRVHGDTGLLKKVYNSLKKYVEYFRNARDRENSGLYDVINHYETGQEFMSRYLAVDREADRDNWGAIFRLKGVDSTVYLYEIKKALLQTARILGIDEDIELWESEIEKTKNAVLEFMWDPEIETFSDVDPKNYKRTGIKAAVCFYPYFTDIVTAEHIRGLKSHLLNPEEFWTPYPVPSSSREDEFFSANGEWKGKRLVCPWNGRVWPMTNSHIAEALAESAIRFNDNELREKAAEFIDKFIKMMFFDGNVNMPNCFEHYNPVNGKPSVFRGIDDYQHSWVVDLIVKYVCGIRPEENEIVFDPFPFDLESFTIDNLFVRGKKIRIEREADKYKVWINSELLGEKFIGEIMKVKI